ncbi:hypothetical protein SK355_08630 [Candidatus Fukatsuia symbiotica]|uniref:Uncharacterized protein n=1 Tax=Candidatus Fukatsuia symbiotica TaxID=1878942 RepID=A0A2U8IA56_9GAMM|nr:hypothetical protein [Candidatus Fukatsuia symbiotica]AWK14945.1 hypothetical protein CCS41_11440 [Candidatus Fukatsuia symbiotica]MEA9445305.1 hypothetical protein [Candidatus Fukatsuia symbiotica]
MLKTTTEIASLATPCFLTTVDGLKNPQDADRFFSKLDCKTALDYIEKNPEWFKRLEKPYLLIPVLSGLPDGELTGISPHLLHSMTLSDIGKFFSHWRELKITPGPHLLDILYTQTCHAASYMTGAVGDNTDTYANILDQLLKHASDIDYTSMIDRLRVEKNPHRTLIRNGEGKSEQTGNGFVGVMSVSQFRKKTQLLRQLRAIPVNIKNSWNIINIFTDNETANLLKLTRASSSSYRAMITSLDALHRTSGREQITAAFTLKMQLRSQDTDRKTVSLLDKQITQALFNRERVAPCQGKLIKIAEKNLSFAVDFYQILFNTKLSSRSDLINFLLKEVSDTPPAAANEIKKIYDSIYYTKLDVAHWDSKYAGTARNSLNERLFQVPSRCFLEAAVSPEEHQRIQDQHVKTQLRVVLEQGPPGVLLGYDDSNPAQYRNSLNFIVEYIDKLKAHGISTLCLPLTTERRRSVEDYMESGMTAKIVHLPLALRNLCSTAYKKGIRVVTLSSMGNPNNIVERALLDSKAVTRLSQLSCHEKFIVVYQQNRLLSEKVGDHFLPGIALQLGLPAVELKSPYQLSFLDEVAQRKASSDRIS